MTSGRWIRYCSTPYHNTDGDLFTFAHKIKIRVEVSYRLNYAF
jgi:hypothetical protein